MAIPFGGGQTSPIVKQVSQFQPGTINPGGPVQTGTIPRNNLPLPKTSLTRGPFPPVRPLPPGVGATPPATPPQAPALPAPSSLTSENPYTAQINALVAPHVAQLNANNTQALDQLLGKAQQGLVNYGGTADSLPLTKLFGVTGTPLQNALSDPLYAGAATNNPNSAMAHIAQQLATTNDTTLGQLAGTGMLHSGEYQQNVQSANQAASLDQGAATQNFLDYIQGLYGGYQSTLNTNQGAENQDVTNALNMILAQIKGGVSLPGPTGVTPGAAPHSPLPSAGPDAWQRAIQPPSIPAYAPSPQTLRDAA